MYTDLPIDIIDQLREAFDKVSAHFPEGARDPEWTKAVKTEIGLLGERLGLEVCAGGVEKREGWCPEWLFDLTWYHGDGQVKSIPLVLESEWLRDDKDLRVDFEKLLVAKSKVKVFVFQTKTAERMNDVHNRLISAIHKFQPSVPGEIYVFACLDEYKLSFSILTYTV
jgi:hypothetical protein